MIESLKAQIDQTPSIKVVAPTARVPQVLTDKQTKRGAAPAGHLYKYHTAKGGPNQLDYEQLVQAISLAPSSENLRRQERVLERVYHHVQLTPPVDMEEEKQRLRAEEMIRGDRILREASVGAAFYQLHEKLRLK
jgi:hypothetical protein